MAPDQIAIEKVFVNVNPQSTLLLGQARGAAICAAVLHDLPVAEYTALQVKQAVVGNGHAAKEQVQEMVKRLLQLPGVPEHRRRRRARVRDLPCARRPGPRQAGHAPDTAHETREARLIGTHQPAIARKESAAGCSSTATASAMKSTCR